MTNTASPRRIQRMRTAGWRMPEGCIYVGRPTIWGNPFVAGQPSGVFTDEPPLTMITALSLPQSIEFYRTLVSGCISPEMHPHGHDWFERFRKQTFGAHPAELVRALRGHDLCCWCPPGPCHADVLLELANAGHD